MKKKLVHKIISVIVILMMVMSSAAISFADTDSAASSNQKALKQATAEKEAAAEEAAEKEAAEKEAAAKAEAERIAAEKAEAERIAEEEKAAAEREAAEKEAAEKAAAEKEAAEKAAAEKDAADKDAAEKESKNSVRDASEPKAEKKSKEEKSEADSDKAIQESKKNRKGTGEKALSNGTYAVENFEFSGGTGKAKLTCESVIVKDGKAYAVFSASSANMTHVYMGEAPSSDETTSLYDPKTGAMGKDVYRIIDQITYAPVELNESKPVAARTTAMSEPHWVQYQYKITLSAQAQKVSSDTTIPDKYASSGGGNPETGNITLSDGTYKVSNFSFSGGTGKTNWTCDNVIIAGGKAYAAMQCSSANMTHIYMGTAGTTDEDKTLYDPDKDQGKAGVYRMILQTAWVPVVLNQNFPMAGRSTAMSDPHWIQYQCNITLAKDAEKVSDNATVPEGYAVDAFGDGGGDNPGDNPGGDNPGGQEGGNEPSSPADPTPSTTSKLSDGTWKVKATTDRKMFYLYPKETNPAQVILVKKGNSMTATITLTGDGYDYVYMGTPAQAKRAGIKNWIKAKIVNGYYTFTIPVSALDKKLAITPHSKKYETDANPATDPWRPDKWIIFYSAGAVKVKDGTTVTPTKSKSSKQKTSGNATSGTQGKVKLTDKKKDKVSKWKDDSGKSTSAVNNKTSLKDGVYAPDRFSWSGGSGRLAYIKCTKITVTGGKSYATIVFGSTKYDSLKAAGRVFSKSGGGNSTFTIPIKLNANNTIIGRTTAMSQPHWVKYNIFVYKKGASGTSGDTAKGDDGHVTSTKKLSDKAPDLMGLKQKKGKALEKAEYFRIFRYEKGITLISVDQTKDTALYKKENKNSKKAKQNEDNQPKVEYDEEGKPIARSQNQITEELYKNNVVNYLIVPKGIEIPAGLYKDCIIINQPVHNTYVFSGDMMETICELGLADKIALAGIREEDVKGEAAQKALSGSRMLLTGDTEKPDYAAMVKNKVDLAVLPDDVLPEKVKKEEKSLFGSDDSEKAQEEAKKKEKTLGVMQKRFAALNVPMLILRDADEKTNYGQAEWIKVFGAIYGEDAKADKAFQKFKKSHKEKKLNKKEENQKDQKNEEK